MPAFDGTGPWGQGPLTGRGMGFCAGCPVPGHMNSIGGRGHRGQGRGGGRGMGGGMGRGRGRGTGAGYGAAPVPLPRQPSHGAGGDEELAMLKQQAAAISQQMQHIRERIGQLQGAGQVGLTATVDPKKCMGCGLCVEVCPVEAIRLEDEVAVVDAQSCTGCRACVRECPNKAISMA